MNKVILMGRLTKDPEIRYTQGNESICIARYVIAVDRRGARNEEQTADFINIVVFGKGAEFAEKYLHKGIKIVLTGRIQTGSYTNRDGQKVYTAEVVAEDQEFAEKKNADETGNVNNKVGYENSDFMNLPEGIEDDLPFNQPSK